MDVTILYFTANVEEKLFAEKIRKNILDKKGNIPIVSVSQKPIDFGKNICVGTHYICYLNAIRQIQIGLNEIKTSYVIAAEADFLYPPEYFQFNPIEKNCCYRYFGVWVCYCLHFNYPNPRFHFKGYSGGAQIIDRNLWLNNINKILKNRKEWATINEKATGRFTIKTNNNYTWTGNPIITFKTKHNINKGTALQKKVWPKKSLPYWGSAIDLRKKMFVT